MPDRLVDWDVGRLFSFLDQLLGFFGLSFIKQLLGVLVVVVFGLRVGLRHGCLTLWRPLGDVSLEDIGEFHQLVTHTAGGLSQRKVKRCQALVVLDVEVESHFVQCIKNLGVLERTEL